VVTIPMSASGTMSDDSIIRLDDICLSFGRLQVLVDVGMDIKKGAINALIGPNGAGKTCIINVITGFYRPQRGRVFFKGNPIVGLRPHQIARLGIARTFQNIQLFTGLSVVENLLAAMHTLIRPSILPSFIYFGLERSKDLKARKTVEEIIDFLEIESIRHRLVGTLPYGLRRRVELGRAIVMRPEVILLDEIMAGMNVEEKEDMARFILDMKEEWGLPILLIEHDMAVVMDISDRVTVMDLGQKIAEGTPEEIRSNPEVIRAYLGVGGR
jgi:branched-chain amino acid transport system ATP-binding protein